MGVVIKLVRRRKCPVIRPYSMIEHRISNMAPWEMKLPRRLWERWPFQWWKFTAERSEENERN